MVAVPLLVVEDALPLSEAALARLWEGQRLPAAALVTQDGRSLRVLHPGRRPGGAGPDFRDAVLAGLAQAPLRGDIELHVRSSDFAVHGHQRDHAYDGLVLHLVFDHDASGPTLLASGRTVPVVALGAWVAHRATELQLWLTHPALWREPCWDAIHRLGREAVLAELARLGDARFGARASELAAAIQRSGPADALYRALLAGVAYGGDRAAFESLADVMPWPVLAEAMLRGVEEGEALLMGPAGLLPSQQGRSPAHEREERWERMWAAAARDVMPAPLAAAASRPANAPARRLAGLAALLARHTAGAALALEGGPAELVAAWTVHADAYWRRFRAPGEPSTKPLGALIGRGRAIELLVNAVLPWVAAQGGDAAVLAREQFTRLPRPGAYGRLRFLEANLAEADGRPLRLDARHQQGLLALYKSECTQGGCGRCALS